MFGSGVLIGTAITIATMKPIQRVHHRVRTVCFAVAVGTSLRTTVTLRFGIGTVQAAGTAASGSGLFCLWRISTYTDFCFARKF